ncbi:hypothetical protein EDC01DRAFT_788023 [Geopyxis carbonaria]|nr:hypothetical protein EDC01DRAFT_788023 [Geopyxis carbonaria]
MFASFPLPCLLISLLFSLVLSYPQAPAPPRTPAPAGPPSSAPSGVPGAPSAPGREPLLAAPALPAGLDTSGCLPPIFGLCTRIDNPCCSGDCFIFPGLAQGICGFGGDVVRPLGTANAPVLPAGLGAGVVERTIGGESGGEGGVDGAKVAERAAYVEPLVQGVEGVVADVEREVMAEEDTRDRRCTGDTTGTGDTVFTAFHALAAEVMKDVMEEVMAMRTHDYGFKMGWYKNLQNRLHPPHPARTRYDSERALLSSHASPTSTTPRSPTPGAHTLSTSVALHRLLHRHFRTLLLLLFLATTCILYTSLTAMSAAPSQLLATHDAAAADAATAAAMRARWPKLQRYYAGLYELVPAAANVREYPPRPPTTTPVPAAEGHMAGQQRARVFDPYPREGVECGFGGRRAPVVRAYDGVPRGMPDAVIGSAKELGLDESVCFERYGRLGDYGLGYAAADGGLGAAVRKPGEAAAEAANGWGWEEEKIDWRGMDWGKAQEECVASNADRFGDGKRPRTAVLLRTWTGYDYTPDDIANMRALVSELSIHTRGEYNVHILVHVKNASLPFWTSPELHAHTLATSNLPPEFHGLAWLWSETQMRSLYAAIPDDSARYKHATLAAEYGFQRMPVHEVYRSTFMPVQAWSQSHPEFEYVWNWEMDIRYTGHLYHLFNRLDTWSTRQPTSGAWERAARFYVPSIHGAYSEFVGNTTDSDNAPADLITLNPLFDPTNTTWILRHDHPGFPPSTPRRAAVITASRLSRRLLTAMHAENTQGRTMFSEMWPASAALHAGMKAVYAPHPVFVDRRWPVAWLERTFNGVAKGAVFGVREHNFEGSSWYYNARWAGGVYRRWAGIGEGGGEGEGGAEGEERERGEERGEKRGRMCLRGGWLVHPVKDTR